MANTGHLLLMMNVEVTLMTGSFLFMVVMGEKSWKKASVATP